MKKLSLALAILIALALPLAALAQSDISSYTSGFQLQNLNQTTDAQVTIQFINQDGSEDSRIDDTIPAGTDKTYFPLAGVTEGFNGSVVIASNTEVAAVANVLANGTAYVAAYGGFTAGAQTVNVPLVMKGNVGAIDTWFNVQNTGAAAATVTVDYEPGTCSDSATIQPGAAATFDQAADTCLPAGYVGAATVTSNGEPIAVTVMQTTSTANASLKPNLLASNGFTSESTNPVMPLFISHYFNIGTGIQVQNTGGSDTNVTISYSPSAGFPGAPCTETKAVQAGQSVTFGFPDLPGACYTAEGFVGSAKVTTNSANQGLVAVVNQLTLGTSRAGAYNAFNPAEATSNVSLPLIMDNNVGIFTGFSIANVGTQPTDISCTFANTPYTVSQNNVAPGAAVTDDQLGKISDGYVGSATCTASGGDAMIVGVLNQLNTGSVLPGIYDGLAVSEGFNY